MKLKQFVFALCAVALASCNDTVEEPEMRAGGVEIFTETGREWVNGTTITMPSDTESMIFELGSRGITENGLIVISASIGMSIELLDPYDPEKLTVYDRIKCSDGDKVWYDNLYKQRFLVTAATLPGEAQQRDREMEVKVIPEGGYNVYSTFTILHPATSENTKPEQ